MGFSCSYTSPTNAMKQQIRIRKDRGHRFVLDDKPSICEAEKEDGVCRGPESVLLARAKSISAGISFGGGDDGGGGGGGEGGGGEGGGGEGGGGDGGGGGGGHSKSGQVRRIVRPVPNASQPQIVS